MITVSPGAEFESFLEEAPAGLVGALTWRLIDPSDGSIEIAASTAGITEVAVGTYRRVATAPEVNDTYLIVWANGPTEATEELVVSYASDFAPTIDDVAVLLSRRWRQVGTGDYLDGPTADTVPTAEQVTRILGMQTSLVLAETGDLTDDTLLCPAPGPDRVRDAAAAVIAARTALIVELSFWPEEIADNRDTAAEWRAIIDGDQAAVVSAARECAAGAVLPGDAGEGAAVAPVYSFEQQTQRLSW